jgi:hypothetical protein
VAPAVLDEVVAIDGFQAARTLTLEL